MNPDFMPGGRFYDPGSAARALRKPLAKTPGLSPADRYRHPNSLHRVMVEAVRLGIDLGRRIERDATSPNGKQDET